MAFGGEKVVTKVFYCDVNKYKFIAVFQIFVFFVPDDK